jgi:hypothetical protein
MINHRLFKIMAYMTLSLLGLILLFTYVNGEFLGRALPDILHSLVFILATSPRMAGVNWRGCAVSVERDRSGRIEKRARVQASGYAPSNCRM